MLYSFKKSSEGEAEMVAALRPDNCSILEMVEVLSEERVSVLAIPATIDVAKIIEMTIQLPAIIRPHKVTGALSP